MNRAILRAASIARTSTPAFATSRASYSSDSKPHAKDVINKAKQEGKDAKLVVDLKEDTKKPPKVVIEEKHTNPPQEINDGKPPGQRKKTVVELDEELKLKLEGISGGGGASGLEYEDGKAVAMRRGVRDNMFRYI